MQGPALGFICVLLLVAIPIGLLIGALILRAAVWLANKCLPQPASRYYDDEYDDEDDWDSYDRPRRPRGGRRSSIPEPSLGRAMLIVFVNAVASVVVSLPINIAMGVGVGRIGGNQDPIASLIASCIQFPISFLIDAAILTVMLPTSFGRGCLVVLFKYLIVIVIIVVIAVPLIILGVVFGG